MFSLTRFCPMYSSRRFGRTLTSSRASSSNACPDTIRSGCLCGIIRFAVPSAILLFPPSSPNPESALVGAQHTAHLQPKFQRTTHRAQRVLLARSALVVRRATTSQNFRRPLRASHLRPRLPQHARRIRDSPAPKQHRLRFPRAKTPPASPSPQSRFPVCPSTPPPCVPPFCVPRLEFSLAAPDRSHESPARVPRRSSRSKSSAPEPAPRRKPKATSQKNVFPARRQTRTAPAHLRAHECGSGGLLRYAARRVRRTSKAAPARRSPRRPRPRALDSVFFRQAVREAGQSSLASIAAFPSPVNAQAEDRRINEVTERLEVGRFGGLAPGAVFADRFVDQRVEFAARQRHVIARIFSAVTGDGQFRSAARRRRDKVARTRRHKLGDFAAGEQRRLTGHFRSQRDFRAVLDGFHSEERRKQIRAASYRAVVGK